MNDRDLLQAFARQKSEAAFQELVRRHGNLVYSCARQRVGDPHAAEDMPVSVAAQAVKAATAVAGGTMATTSTLMLAKGALHAMFIAKVKTAVLITAASVVVTGTGLVAVQQIVKPTSMSANDAGAVAQQTAQPTEPVTTSVVPETGVDLAPVPTPAVDHEVWGHPTNGLVASLRALKTSYAADERMQFEIRVKNVSTHDNNVFGWRGELSSRPWIFWFGNEWRWEPGQVSLGHFPLRPDEVRAVTCTVAATEVAEFERWTGTRAERVRRLPEGVYSVYAAGCWSDLRTGQVQIRITKVAAAEADGDGAPVPGAFKPIDATKPGTYRDEKWAYHYSVVAEGPQKGYRQGFLWYGSADLMDPEPGAYILTPWGWMQWQDRPTRGNWLPVAEKPAKGKQLPDPAVDPSIVSRPPPTPK